MLSNRSIMQAFKLDWVTINEQTKDCKTTIEIWRYHDGSISKEDLLKREIPPLFIAILRLCNPCASVSIAEGIVSQERIDAEQRMYKMMWAGYD